MDGREQDEVVDAVVRVHTAAEHQVRGVADQFLAGGVQRRQRGRARRVHRVVHAAEIETVGDPPGDDVREHAGEGVLVQCRQAFGQGGWDRPEEGRVGRAEAVGGGEVRAGLGAEDHRRARPVERPVVVAGVAQSPRGHLEGEQLPGFYAAQRLRRDTEAQRVERDRREEPAPPGRHPPAAPPGIRATRGPLVRGLDGSVVEVRVPAAARHLGDRVDAPEHVGPVLGGVGGAREHTGHADDGHVQRTGGLAAAAASTSACPGTRPCPGTRLCRGARPGRLPERRADVGISIDVAISVDVTVGDVAVGVDAESGETVDQRLGGALAHLGVQGSHRGRLRPQRRHLADHEHTVVTLDVLVDGYQPAAVAAQALARDPRPAEVELFQLLPHLRGGESLGKQLGPPPGERGDER